MSKSSARAIAELRRTRPRNWVGRITGLALLALVVVSWTTHNFGWRHLFTARSAENFARFRREITPYPLQERAFDWDIFTTWLHTALTDKVMAAVVATLALSIAAIVLAAVIGAILSLFAARTLATADPYLPGPNVPHAARRHGWRALCAITRGFLIFMRAIPEYVWAYLFKAMLGLTAWPAVLALALHNGGILGKLNAEVIENVDPKTPRALRALGASRLQIAATAIAPTALNRFLLYFFYRWETCVREATVLGMLGFVSLGWFITDAQVRTNYDEMFLFILLGAGIILVGDLVSAGARRLIRRAK